MSGKLNNSRAEALCKPGRYGDGDGLYLVVGPTGGKNWVFLYRQKRRGEPGPGKRREMGLGRYGDDRQGLVGLASARKKASEARAALLRGQDPLEVRDEARRIPTFGEMADQVIAIKAKDYKSARSVARINRHLKQYAKPLSQRGVETINTQSVLGILQPIWEEKPETAEKVRSHIQMVLNAAKARGFRPLDELNPATLKGHLDQLLHRSAKRKKGHHAAMAYAVLPSFMDKLRAREAVSALCLEFLILTAARSAEARDATWSEIDLDGAVWTIPGERMKEEEEHRVPLSPAAVAVLRRIAPQGAAPDAYLFPGQKAGRPLSNMVFRKLLDRMGEPKVTAHGFRAAFSTWAREQTMFPREIVEASLAHAVGTDVERAYARTTFFDKRRTLMEAWAAYCAGNTNVTLFAQASAA